MKTTNDINEIYVRELDTIHIGEDVWHEITDLKDNLTVNVRRKTAFNVQLSISLDKQTLTIKSNTNRVLILMGFVDHYCMACQIFIYVFFESLIAEQWRSISKQFDKNCPRSWSHQVKVKQIR